MWFTVLYRVAGMGIQAELNHRLDFQPLTITIKNALTIETGINQLIYSSPPLYLMPKK